MAVEEFELSWGLLDINGALMSIIKSVNVP